MPKFFNHGRPPFAQRQGKAGVEVVVRGDAVCDHLGFGEQNVAGDFGQHEILGGGVQRQRSEEGSARAQQHEARHEACDRGGQRGQLGQ